ncbi:MAG: inositol-3-phosphate synthase [Bradymonadales bacterium]|nr:MAG: inositol-3-phosphate synthase [Bradymonadales bacterium]
MQTSPSSTGKIRLAIVGVGNCASSLVQGIQYYREAPPEVRDQHLGLMHYDLGGYTPESIEVVAAFDVDKRKVGQPLEKAIFALPNCTTQIVNELKPTGVKVQMGVPHDGVSDHMKDFAEHRAFRLSSEQPVDVVQALKDSRAEVLICYLPVGSEEAVQFYAQCCLEAKVAMVNCMPVFIASREDWAEKFKAAGLPIVGDDIKSQVGATIVHRVLTKLFSDRGVQLKRTYQLNTGGNTDFLNMLNHNRLKSKKISKTAAVQSQLPVPLDPDNIHIGPSDYVPWQNDNKVCFLRMEGEGFAGVPLHLEMRLSVEDSPNSAGVAIEAIRCAKLALDRKVSGPLYSISSYTMKHPPVQYPDSEAYQRVEDFIAGKIEV